MKRLKKITASLLLASLTVTLAIPAFGHGYVNEIPSRAYLGSIGLQSVGPVQHEPHSLEYLKGFPNAGPADGKIASAGGKFGGVLDEQTSTRWLKSKVYGGVNTISWKLTAAHSTSKFHYYITKKGWDPNSPLKKADFEHIGTFEYQGAKPEPIVSHNVNIPTDREGYYVILAVWDVSDTVNAFYQVIDVDLINNTVQPPVQEQAPTSARNLKAVAENANLVKLTWDAPTSANAKDYSIYRSVNDAPYEKISSSTGTSFSNTTVTPNTSYKYYVVASNTAGDSSKSNIVSVTTPAAPFEVKGLHTMSVASNKVDIMWSRVDDNFKVQHYNIYRTEPNGTSILLAESTTARYVDNTAQPNKTYEYSVTAVSSTNGLSSPAKITVKTPEAAPEVIPPEVTEPETVNPEGAKPWNANSYYNKGDKVIFNNKLYEATQSFQGHGDPSWSPEQSLALWNLVN